MSAVSRAVAKPTPAPRFRRLSNAKIKLFDRGVLYVLRASWAAGFPYPTMRSGAGILSIPDGSEAATSALV
jgi:hypothetical protein